MCSWRHSSILVYGHILIFLTQLFMWLWIWYHYSPSNASRFHSTALVNHHTICQEHFNYLNLSCISVCSHRFPYERSLPWGFCSGHTAQTSWCIGPRRLSMFCPPLGLRAATNTTLLVCSRAQTGSIRTEKPKRRVVRTTLGVSKGFSSGHSPVHLRAL